MTTPKKLIPVTNEHSSILTSEMTTSAKIRALFASGMDRSQIAVLLDKRYQHVRNVLITPIKKQ
jgi:hypothetical protein